MTLRSTKAWIETRRHWYHLLEHWPALWANHFRAPGRNVADRDTVLGVEGAAGSSNSFVREAIIASNPGIRLASHAHTGAHVRYAVGLGLPLLVLLRPPLDSITSFVARARRPRTLKEMIVEYERFYRVLAPRHDRMALAHFEDATSRLGTVVDMVNRQFGTTIVPFPDDDAVLRQRVEDTIAAWARHRFGDDVHKIALPHGQRDERRDALRDELQRTMPDRLARCQALYETSAEVARQRMARHLAAASS